MEDEFGVKMNRSEAQILRFKTQRHPRGMAGKKHSEATRLLFSIQRKGKLTGPNNPAWNGGTTSTSQKFRTSKAYIRWRTAVFERDSYTCVQCGQKGGRLNADHIQPYRLFPELGLSLENGRTLCVECHKLTDSYGWKGRQ